MFALTKAYVLIGFIVCLIFFGLMQDYLVTAALANEGDMEAKAKLEVIATKHPTRFSLVHLASKLFYPHFKVIAHLVSRQGAL